MKQPVGISFLLVLATAILEPFPAAAIEDPGLPGPYAVAQDDYDLGQTNIPSQSAPVEVIASVHYPVDLSSPRPLIAMVHGASVFGCIDDPGAPARSNCPSDKSIFPHHEGFDYIGEQLASHGFIAFSLNTAGVGQGSAQGPGQNDAARIWQRGELIQHHLRLWEAWNELGGAPFSNPNHFLGRVDMTRVGVIGHSRGGEAAVMHYLVNAEDTDPLSIGAIVALAPTDFNGMAQELYNPDSHALFNEVPIVTIIPYCDGDVKNAMGARLFDAMRYYTPGNQSTKHAILAHGANHVFFNRAWTPGEFPGLPNIGDEADEYFGADPGRAGGVCESEVVVLEPHCDSASPTTGRISSSEQRALTAAYVSASFRRYLEGETKFESILTGHSPRPTSAQAGEVSFSFHPPESLRLDVNRTLDDDSLEVNNLDPPMAVTTSGLDVYSRCGDLFSDRPRCVENGSIKYWIEPHAAHTIEGVHLGTSTLDIHWTEPAPGAPAPSYKNDLPAGTDISNYFMLHFRVGVNVIESAPGADQNLRVVIVDGNGESASIEAGEYSDSLYHPPGLLPTADMCGSAKILLNSVSIPLTAFAGIDKSDVRSVELVFDQPNSLGTVEGAVLLTDISFSSLPAVTDLDQDEVIDAVDNCTTFGNASPMDCDTDLDGFGNFCDADFDQSGGVNPVDFNIFMADFQVGSDSGVGTDMDCMGSVNATDYQIFMERYQAGQIGPSGLDCAGEPGCEP